MNLTRIARTTSAAVVAGVAAVASYSHMRDLAAAHGQSPLLANLLPISVDGMLVVASAVMADDRAAGRPVRTWARVSFVVGVAASIVANVLAAQPDLVARVISAWPALALLLVVEMLAGKPRSAPAVKSGPEPAAVQPEPVDEPEVDQERVGPWTFAEPVQPQPEPVQRTARTKRTTRTAPAETKPVPPRVLEMARALDLKYPGPIPGRRTVMPAMGWSSVGDAQAAINHLKAERAKGTPPVRVPDSPAELDRVAV